MRTLCVIILAVLIASVTSNYLRRGYQERPAKRTLPKVCDFPESQRQDCGWPGITRKQCQDKDCCFDDSIRNVPWCFFGKAPNTQPPDQMTGPCAIPLEHRTNCGWPGISPDHCDWRGCCFDSSGSAGFKCYFGNDY